MNQKFATGKRADVYTLGVLLAWESNTYTDNNEKIASGKLADVLHLGALLSWESNTFATNKQNKCHR